MRGIRCRISRNLVRWRPYHWFLVFSTTNNISFIALPMCLILIKHNRISDIITAWSACRRVAIRTTCACCISRLHELPILIPHSSLAICLRNRLQILWNYLADCVWVPSSIILHGWPLIRYLIQCDWVIHLILCISAVFAGCGLVVCWWSHSWLHSNIFSWLLSLIIP